jgi:hypothetical protein
MATRLSDYLARSKAADTAADAAFRAVVAASLGETRRFAECGPHCGFAGRREGHCDCALCHDGNAPVVITREDLAGATGGTPMCARWYERAGDYRPWHAGTHAPGPRQAAAGAG